MKFLISAGHGGNDPGNTSNGRSEAEICVRLRNIVAKKLTDLGHDVITDGIGKENWVLGRAIRLITGRVSLEIHTNASSNVMASGVEVVSLPKDKQLAQLIAVSVAKTLVTNVRRDRGWLDPKIIEKERGFFPGFVRGGGMILETFFQTNKRELDSYDAKEWLVASAIVEALTS